MSTIDTSSSYVIQGQTLQNICDAVKTKTGASTVSVSDIATEIENIPTGGGSETVTCTINSNPSGLNHAVYTDGNGSIQGFDIPLPYPPPYTFQILKNSTFIWFGASFSPSGDFGITSVNLGTRATYKYAYIIKAERDFTIG